MTALDEAVAAYRLGDQTFQTKWNILYGLVYSDPQYTPLRVILTNEIGEPQLITKMDVVRTLLTGMFGGGANGGGDT